MQAAAQLGHADFKNLVSLTSLSKRNNVPGLRSGFVAGDAAILQQFLLYRTYHGCAMSPVVQAADIAAWQDEAHVVDNRALYRAKFAQVTPLLAEVLDVALPDAGFYLWADVGGDELAFTRELYATYNVTVLPGSYLARGRRATTPARDASAWLWLPTPPSVCRPPSASATLCNNGRAEARQNTTTSSTFIES